MSVAFPDKASPTQVAPRAVAASVRRRVLVDRVMRWVVSAGGLGIIVSVLGILFFIVAAVVPLLRPARVDWAAARGLSPAVAQGIGGSRALAGDEYETRVVTLGVDGVVRVLDAETAQEIESRAVTVDGERVLEAVTSPDGRLLSATTSLGRVLLLPVRFDITFAGDQRVVKAVLPEPIALEVTTDGVALGRHAAERDEDGNATVAVQLADGRLVVLQRSVTRNLMSGEETAETTRIESATSPALSALLIDVEQRNVYGGTREGNLTWWTLESGALGTAKSVAAGAPITALTLLIGGRSLVVGQESGALSVWFPVRDAQDVATLTRIRDFPAHGGAIVALTPSARNKAFLAVDAVGEMGLYYSTSERVLWRGKASVDNAFGIAYSPKGDGAVVLGTNGLSRVRIDNPHPEVSWKALFGKIWYESYEEPKYVWQSTGGTDDFEPKLGMTPLIVGTIKGTIYSLLIAIPLGVFGAMFASQFLHPKVLRTVKPLVEVMAALPSVVLGFLAGLWLAPRVEKGFPALILAVVLVPLFVLAAGAAWNALPRAFRGRFPDGAELVPYGGAILAAAGASYLLAKPFADLAFGGNFQDWLLRTTGLPYDQRNAVVVGLAMGFAVIPIIFAISEDAFSNVPRNLAAGSLALGANRWQTVTRVILPTASPGIFSAIMIGFGRAVGETMIVLMATGNTPILDLNAFNGFRTLSANIAVEIPEAPLGGTLYRVLFLAALLLFLMTFVVNTGAELVRQRLRRKFAQL
jgi:phosphate transport system permease protein